MATEEVNWKAGDRIRCIHQGDGLTVGKVYEVFQTSLYSGGVIWDDDGDSRLLRHVAPWFALEEPEHEPVTEDIVTKPAHYTKWAIEPITFIMRNGFEFWRGNIVKYASRAGSKLYEEMDEAESEITDLRKVIRYAEMRINQLKGEVEL